MKYAKFAAVVLILFFLGYVLGPTLNPMLVKDQEPENLLKVAVKYRGATYEIDLAEYSDADLPKTVEIKELTMIPTASGEGKFKLREGDRVKLLNRKDAELIVESLDGMAKGTIPPRNTDIYEALAQKKYDDEAARNGVAVVPKIPTETDKTTSLDDPKPMEQTDPVDPVAALDPDPIMPAELDPAPDPGETPALEPTPTSGGDLSKEEIVALMKKSIEGGALKEFTLDQVKDWKAEEKETIDGTEYQIGLAAYETVTIFGVGTAKAKALIKDGKIERWVHAKSGMEIQ